MHSILLMSLTWIQVLQLLAALSILIVLHEGGHFFFARLFKTRVEKFYLFFDFLFPFSGLLNFALFKKKKGDTEYGIGWFPLGGYVKISGMIDESMDKEAMAQPPQPWEYRSKKAYQRLFIMLGGIIVNTLVAIVIYMIVFGVYGEAYLPTKSVTNGIAVDSVAKAIGLRTGDIIIGEDGKPMQRFEHVLPGILLYDAKTIEVERDGKEISIPVPSNAVGAILDGDKGSFIMPRVPCVVSAIAKQTAAESMGLTPGDSIVALNNMPVRFYDEFDSMKKTMAVGTPITLNIIRDGKPQELNGKIPDGKIIGFFNNSDPNRYFRMDTIHYNPVEAVGKGFSYTYDKFKEYILQFKLFKKINPNKGLGGIISFGRIFPTEFDLHTFLMLTAFISVILAFMNLLPIPGLDGGYVIFLLFEIISGRKVSEKVMERATTVGLILLLTLMVYANGLDILRLFKK